MIPYSGVVAVCSIIVNFTDMTASEDVKRHLSVIHFSVIAEVVPAPCGRLFEAVNAYSSQCPTRGQDYDDHGK
jgi:hypothetical protein